MGVSSGAQCHVASELTGRNRAQEAMGKPVRCGHPEQATASVG